ncbi:MAG TPA: bifunctional precorrin-2 dehydrogenase/sirohydrochlorin ferrochelatase [Phycisphaerae bacterium]|nr:bifunctional precorrin-2 dehydrogenase/sirohydrochlorin ferrochelatase [Phycisphaerae bacterium]
MRTFPIMLDLRGRAVVVVGAGSVGLRKVASLHRAGAKVKLVARRIGAEALPADVETVVGEYETGMLAGAFLVFACTDDEALNARIAADARSAGALVNVADTPGECDFYLPAVRQVGEVTVAIGTGGGVPALSAWLRQRVGEALPQRLAEFADALADARVQLRRDLDDGTRRMAIMKKLVCERTYQAFLSGGPAAVHAELERLRNR